MPPKYTISPNRREQPCVYENLLPVEVEKICNGCGRKGGIVDVPEFVFHDDCNWHDFQYFLGGCELARRTADDKFYEKMKAHVDEAAWYRRWYLRWIAKRYYKAVQLAGVVAFSYGIKKGWQDVEDVMNASK